MYALIIYFDICMYISTYISRYSRSIFVSMKMMLKAMDRLSKGVTKKGFLCMSKNCEKTEIRNTS